MTVGRTNWTSDEVAAMLRCHRSHTTVRLSRFADTFASMLPTRADLRPDRLAEKMMSFLRTGGRLAEADPDGLRRFLREVAQGDTFPTGRSPGCITRPGRPGRL